MTGAVLMTLAGIALAFIGTLLTYLYFEGLFAEMLRLASADSGDAQLRRDLKEIADIYSGTGVFLGAGANLLAGAGAAVCAVLTLRGSNGARVALCSLTGGFAGWKLLCGGSWLFSVMGLMDSLRQEGVSEADFSPPYEPLYGALMIDAILMLLGIGIMTLLLLGPSSRYFRKPAPAGFPGAFPTGSPIRH